MGFNSGFKGLKCSAHGRFEPLRFLYRSDRALCWKQAVVPEAASLWCFPKRNCRVFWALRWPRGSCQWLRDCKTIHLLARTSGVRTVRHLFSSACRWRKSVWLLCRTGADWTRHTSRSCAECSSPLLDTAGSFQTTGLTCRLPPK